MQAQIQDKYKVKPGAVIEEALDEYGEELVFESDDDDEDSPSDEESKEASAAGQAEEDDKKREQRDDESGDELDSGIKNNNQTGGLMSSGFSMEALIKDQYAFGESHEKATDALKAGGAAAANDDEADSFEVLDSASDEEEKKNEGNDEAEHNSEQVDEAMT